MENRSRWEAVNYQIMQPTGELSTKYKDASDMQPASGDNLESALFPQEINQKHMTSCFDDRHRLAVGICRLPNPRVIHSDSADYPVILIAERFRQG
jgi:hypothetical protein